MTEKTFENLCIVLPTINECNNLRVLIPQLTDTFRQAAILVVDDNSCDGTQEYLRGLQEQLPNLQVIFRDFRGGIGSAHLVGLKHAIDFGYRYLITMDADMTHRVVDAQNLFSELVTKDIVVGSRYLNQSSIEGWPLFRVVMTRIGHKLTELFFGSDLDMSSGFRGYQLKAIDYGILNDLCPKNYDFFFVSILIFLKSDLKIFQVPVTLNNRNTGRSKMSLRLSLIGGGKLLLYGLRLKQIKVNSACKKSARE